MKELCKPLNEQVWSTDESLLKFVFEAISVYFNYTASARCLDWSADPSAGLGEDGWGVQVNDKCVHVICCTYSRVNAVRTYEYLYVSKYVGTSM